MQKDDVIPYGAELPQAEMDTEIEQPVEKQQVEQPAPVEEQKADYEKRYAELQKKFGEHSNVVGELRKQNQTLQQQMAQLAEQSKAKVEQARDQPPPTDYEKMLREVAAKVEAGDVTFEEGLIQTNKITREWTKAEAAAEKDALLEQARQEVAGILQAKDGESVVKDFHAKNPDFQQLSEDGTLSTLMAEDPLLDNLSAYWKKKALDNQSAIDSAFEKGKADALRVKAGSEKASQVISDPGNSMQTQRKPNRPPTESELRASMLAKLT